MACDSLLTTSLLQVVNRLVASSLSKLFIQVDLFVKSQQMTCCNELDFNRLVCNLIKLTSLLQLATVL